MAVSEPLDWNASAAGRDKWQGVLQEGLAPLGERLMQLAGVAPGMRVLDVGTGTGEPAISAAQRVGPGGSVMGIDSSSQMISVARRRAADLKLGNATFRVSDAERLDTGNRRFDAVVCQLVLMFLSDPVLALAGMREVLEPGGRIAAAVLGPVETTPMVSIWARAFHGDPAEKDKDHGPEESDSRPAGANPFQFADRRDLEEAFVEAGFAEVTTETLTTELSFPSFRHYTDFQMDIRPDLCDSLRERSPEDRAGILGRAREAAKPFTNADGSLKIVTLTNLASGRRR